MLGISKLFAWAMDHRVEVDVDVRSDRVFDYLSDLNHHGEFVGGEVLGSSDGPIKVGSAFVAEVSAGEGGRGEQRYTVTELVPSRRLVYESGQSGGPIEARIFDLRPNGSGGTKIEHGVQHRQLGLILEIVFLLILPISLPLFIIGAAFYRPYVSLSTGRKLRSLTSKIEAMRPCESCSSIYRVSFHVNKGKDIWICGNCALDPAHVASCAYCTDSASKKIDF